jgi:hypothetical protein
MEPVKLPAGYLLPEGTTMADIRRIDAELLASEGLDPKRLGLPERQEDADSTSD